MKVQSNHKLKIDTREILNCLLIVIINFLVTILVNLLLFMQVKYNIVYLSQCFNIKCNTQT